MVKCKYCGIELGPDQTCVFATYKVEMDGKELLVCCERCADQLDDAPPLEAAPVHPVAQVMPPTSPRAARKGRAPKAVKRAARKAAKRSAPRKRRR